MRSRPASSARDRRLARIQRSAASSTGIGVLEQPLRDGALAEQARASRASWPPSSIARAPRRLRAGRSRAPGTARRSAASPRARSPTACSHDGHDALERVVLVEARERVQQLERAQGRARARAPAARSPSSTAATAARSIATSSSSPPPAASASSAASAAPPVAARAIAASIRRRCAATNARRARGEVADLGLDLGVAVLRHERLEQADARRGMAAADCEAARAGGARPCSAWPRS